MCVFLFGVNVFLSICKLDKNIHSRYMKVYIGILQTFIFDCIMGKILLFICLFIYLFIYKDLNYQDAGKPKVRNNIAKRKEGQTM